MPSLTPEQLKMLNNVINNYSVDKIVGYIDQGLVSLEDLTGLTPDKKQLVETDLNSRPNPLETEEWKGIEESRNEPLEVRKTRISNYLKKWEIVNPPKNHIAAAEDELTKIYEEIEATEWKEVDKENVEVESLYIYYERFPRTVHKIEVEDKIWAKRPQKGEKSEYLRRFLEYFPEGKHSAEAREIISSESTWADIKREKDIYKVKEFLLQHLNDDYYADASDLLNVLREQEFHNMKQMGSLYSIARLSALLSQEIITDAELVARGICPQQVLNTLKNYRSVADSLPNIATALANSQHGCVDGRTDVYLFGIPATGKSCILMGLMGTTKMNVNYTRYGGPYAEALKQYLDNGITIPRTATNTVATFDTTIFGKNNVNHYVNLVEMAGEDFAYKLSGFKKPEDAKGIVVDFADMGEGIPELLTNNNRKVFFIIVDPTSNRVSFSKEVQSVDAAGNLGVRLETVGVNQSITLSRMIDVLADPGNAEVMKRVDAIHIIVTKADLFGDNRATRLDKAYDIFKAQYGNLIRPLTNLCNKYDINKATNGVPMLYAFSLGEFHIGGIYEYDPTDANLLAQIMENNSVGEKPESLWNKIQNFLNKPIF